MGRKSLPTALQETKGAYLLHKERRPVGEPVNKTKLSTTAPSEFDDAQKKLWKELMKMLPPGVAYNSDRWALIQLVKLEAKSRKDTLSDAGETRKLAYLGRFGLTPSDRTKINTLILAPVNKLAAFLTKKPAPAPIVVRPSVPLLPSEASVLN